VLHKGTFCCHDEQTSKMWLTGKAVCSRLSVRNTDLPYFCLSLFSSALQGFSALTNSVVNIGTAKFHIKSSAFVQLNVVIFFILFYDKKQH
jgi:hypothetical protein